MKKYVFALATVTLVLVASGCVLPWQTSQNATPPVVIINQTGGDSGGYTGEKGTTPKVAKNCPNCGYYPWYKHTRCPGCGYGDNDGILNCPSCRAYAFHGSSWAHGYCTACGYTR